MGRFIGYSFKDEGKERAIGSIARGAAIFLRGRSRVFYGSRFVNSEESMVHDIY